VDTKYTLDSPPPSDYFLVMPNADKSRKAEKKPHRIHPNSLANLAKSPQPPRKGRVKGELNKVNRNLKTAITEFVDGRSDKLDALIDEIHAVNGAAAAWDRIVGLFEYRLPKLARVEHTGQDGAPIQVVQVSFQGIQAAPNAILGQVQSVDPQQVDNVTSIPSIDLSQRVRSASGLVETTKEEYAGSTVIEDGISLQQRSEPAP
jgi:pyocin large subunit-like protein